jgi:hypothetical protein
VAVSAGVFAIQTFLPCSATVDRSFPLPTDVAGVEAVWQSSDRVFALVRLWSGTRRILGQPDETELLAPAREEEPELEVEPMGHFDALLSRSSAPVQAVAAGVAIAESPLASLLEFEAVGSHLLPGATTLLNSLTLLAAPKPPNNA